MLPQLSRPDPTMSGTNGGIIIGQDFIPLTHHDIPLQSEHYTVLRTVKDSSKWMLSRYLPELLVGQGEQSRRWSMNVTLTWTRCFVVESCKQGIYHGDALWRLSAEKLEQVARGVLYCLDNWGKHGQNPFYLQGQHSTFWKWESFVSYEALIWVKRISGYTAELLLYCVWSRLYVL